MKKVVVVVFELLAIVVLSIVAVLLMLNLSKYVHGSEFDSQYEEYGDTSSKWADSTSEESTMLSLPGLEGTGGTNESTSSWEEVTTEESTIVTEVESETSSEIPEYKYAIHDLGQVLDEVNENAKQYTEIDAVNNTIQNILESEGYLVVEIIRESSTPEVNQDIYVCLFDELDTWYVCYQTDTGLAYAFKE